MKFTRFLSPAGTHVSERSLFLDVSGIEAVYPCVSADPDTLLTEIRMGTGHEYIVVGVAGVIATQIEAELRKL